MVKRPEMIAQLERLAQRAETDRRAMLDEICRYGETDLLCYRAKEPRLAKRQEQIFDPILARLKEKQGLHFNLTDQLVPIPQPAQSLARLRALFAAAPDRELAALYALTPLLGSALLALALWKRQITLGQALEACHLDEAFQAEQWAEDEGEKAAWDTKCQEIEKCAFFLDT